MPQTGYREANWRTLSCMERHLADDADRRPTEHARRRVTQSITAHHKKSAGVSRALLLNRHSLKASSSHPQRTSRESNRNEKQTQAHYATRRSQLPRNHRRSPNANLLDRARVALTSVTKQNNPLAVSASNERESLPSTRAALRTSTRSLAIAKPINGRTHQRRLAPSLSREWRTVSNFPPRRNSGNHLRRDRERNRRGSSAARCENNKRKRLEATLGRESRNSARDFARDRKIVAQCT